MAEKKTGKDDKKKKSAKSKGKGGDAATPYSSIATHPRASVRVRQAKGWGGLGGFVVAGALSLKASVPVVQVLERALLFGVIGYLVAWSLTMFVWRQLMVAEQRAAVDEIQRRRAASQAAEDEADQGRRAAVTGGGSGRP